MPVRDSLSDGPGAASVTERPAEPLPSATVTGETVSGTVRAWASGRRAVAASAAMTRRNASLPLPLRGVGSAAHPDGRSRADSQAGSDFTAAAPHGFERVRRFPSETGRSLNEDRRPLFSLFAANREELAREPAAHAARCAYATGRGIGGGSYPATVRVTMGRAILIRWPGQAGFRLVEETDPSQEHLFPVDRKWDGDLAALGVKLGENPPPVSLGQCLRRYRGGVVVGSEIAHWIAAIH